MKPLSDGDLDARLRAAGALLDDVVATRLAAHEARGPRRAPRLLAVAALVVALGLAAVVATMLDADHDRQQVHTATTTAPPTTRPPSDEVDPAAIRALGASGVIVTQDGLVDLATGALTPLVTVGSPSGGLASPMAVPDGDGGLYYLSHDPDADPDDPDDFGRTDLRHRAADGEDTVVEPGARSFALRADGALALTVPLDPIVRTTGPRRARVVVMTPDGVRTTWTTQPDDYAVTAWAGDVLLAERGLVDTEAADVVAMTAPDQVRDLASYGLVSAVGPDGRWAVVTGLEPGAVRDDGAPPPPARVLDVASGALLGEVDVGDLAGGIGTLTWAGDGRVIAATADAEGRLPLVVELAVDERTDGTVAVTEVRTVVLDTEFRTFIPSDAWTDADGRIMALAYSSDQRYQPRLFVCAPTATECELHELPVTDRGPHSYLADPSRPSRSG